MGCCASSDSTRTRGAFESLNRPLRDDGPLLGTNASGRDHRNDHTAAGIPSGGGTGTGGGGGGSATGATTPNYGTAGSVPENLYPSITKKPAHLDITKSARKRRKQNDRCQLLLNKRTAEQAQQRQLQRPSAATAPSRTSNQQQQEDAARAVHGNENDIRALVRAPPFAEVSDWLAIHTVDFYNDLSLLCGTVLDKCESNAIADRERADSTGGGGAAAAAAAAAGGDNGGTGQVGTSGGGCHMMTAGPKYKYLWKDDKEFTTPTDLSAAQYTNTALEWADMQLDDAEVFPPGDHPEAEEGESHYGPRFRPTVRQIFKLFFRIYAHLYHSHFNDFVELESETHLNDSFRHFIFFVKEFKLLSPNELPPLQQLITFLEQQNEDQERQAEREASAAAAAEAQVNGRQASADAPTPAAANRAYGTV